MAQPSLSLLVSMLLMGAGLGFLGGLFGIGGGIIAIPVLVRLCGFDQAVAQGTALAMMVPNLLFACRRYLLRNPVPPRTALGLALAGTATTFAAAQLAQGLDRGLMALLFSAFLTLLAVVMLPARREGRTPILPARLIPLAGLAGGGAMGLLGIGGGLVATPVLCRVFGLDQRIAQSLALAMVLPCSAAALFAYARAGNVDWPVGAALGLGGLAFVPAGVSLAHAFPEKVMRRLFAGLLVLTALSMVVGR